MIEQLMDGERLFAFSHLLLPPLFQPLVCAVLILRRRIKCSGVFLRPILTKKEAENEKPFIFRAFHFAAGHPGRAGKM